MKIHQRQRKVVVIGAGFVDTTCVYALMHTGLDIARLRSMLSRHCVVDMRNLHAYVLDEHGDSEAAAWSITHIGGVCLSVPYVVGEMGMERILRARLSEDEQAAFGASSNTIRKVFDSLK